MPRIEPRGKPHANLVIPRAAPRLPRGHVRPRREEDACPPGDAVARTVLVRGVLVRAYSDEDRERPRRNRPPRPRPRRRRNRHPRNRPRSRSNPRSNPPSSRSRPSTTPSELRASRLRRRSLRNRFARELRPPRRPRRARPDRRCPDRRDGAREPSCLAVDRKISRPRTRRGPGERLARQFLLPPVIRRGVGSRGANARNAGAFSVVTSITRPSSRGTTSSVTVARTGLWFFMACAAEDAASRSCASACVSLTRYIVSARVSPAPAPSSSSARRITGSVAHAKTPRGVTPRANVPGGAGFSRRFSSLARSFAASFGFLRV